MSNWQTTLAKAQLRNTVERLDHDRATYGVLRNYGFANRPMPERAYLHALLVPSPEDVWANGTHSALFKSGKQFCAHTRAMAHAAAWGGLPSI